MKKYICISLLTLCAFSATAQDFDSKPTVTIDNKEQDLHFTVGARFMADAAYYHTDFTPLQSGASITDARIRTSLTYQNWYFYADFGFGGGKFAQKNIFLQYNQKTAKGGNHDIKVGFAEPRSDGGSNAKLANIIEYGKHGQPAKPFLKPAKTASRQECIDAMTKALDEEVEKL